MFRRLLVAIALALLVASCSSPDVLATVNGESITKDDVYAVYPDWEDPNVVSGDTLRQAVTTLVTFEAIRQAAENDYGVVLDDETIEDRVANPPAQYASVLDPEAMGGSVSDAIIRLNAVQTLLLDTIGPDLIAEQFGGYAAWVGSQPETVTKVCLRYLFVETSADAEAVLVRLDAGEDFIDLVSEVSLDETSPEGLLVDETGSCLIDLMLFNEGIVAAVSGAEVNEPVGPVALGSAGFAVLRVEDRVVPSVAELQADPLQYVDSASIEAAYTEWRTAALSLADVSVSPTLGLWSDSGGGITPPGG